MEQSPAPAYSAYPRPASERVPRSFHLTWVDTAKGFGIILVVLESVRKVYEGLQSLRSMRRMEASRRNASALSVRLSKSLARRRQRLSQARVRSTTHRIGSTSNPLALSDRFTISTA